MAVAKTSAGTSVTDGSSKLTDFGNSSPGHMPKLGTNFNHSFSSTVRLKAVLGMFRISKRRDSFLYFLNQFLK
jgi:hypothetical protein